MPKPDTIPRAKFIQLADSYRALHVLQLQQYLTMAEMIRACLSRLDRKPTGHERAEDLQRNRCDRAEALKGLRDLAAMLEAKGAPSSEPAK